MISFTYSSAYSPPAPVIEVSFTTVADGRRVGPLRAFVDSGADGTLVPLRYLEEIHAPATEERALRSAWGEARRVLLYLVDVQIGDWILPGIHVVGDARGDEIVLGRDVLNQLRVVLDGPAEVIEVLG